jgi:hypothetical protein
MKSKSGLNGSIPSPSGQNHNKVSTNLQGIRVLYIVYQCDTYLCNAANK